MVRSAGALLYQVDDGVLRVLIAHMGGPFWARKDERGWSIPKGKYEDGDDPEVAAAREFREEMGSPLPVGERVALGTIRQSSGKRITAYAVEAGFDTTSVRSNEFEMEWPRGSGVIRSFPEVDRAEWVECATARVKLVSGQVAFLDRLLEQLNRRASPCEKREHPTLTPCPSGPLQVRGRSASGVRGRTWEACSCSPSATAPPLATRNRRIQLPDTTPAVFGPVATGLPSLSSAHWLTAAQSNMEGGDIAGPG